MTRDNEYPPCTDVESRGEIQELLAAFVSPTQEEGYG